MDVVDAYVALLSRAGRDAVPALARGLGLRSAAVATVFAATAAAVLTGLARHRARRGDAAAVAALLAKYGRPADVDAPALAVGAHLARADLDPRLGGLLGDDAAPLVGWLVERTGGPADAVGRAIAASAPLALGALQATAGDDRLDALLAAVGGAGLPDPAALAAGPGPLPLVFHGVRRGSRSLWQRLGAR